ncbi:hypothetical protein E2C01_017081 [Portunus trituberculatus]|uniref:Uncharacterized protein n=1 Tax=Portunus trituberculatus TaxID=210409 RepID=A0A5B7DQY3_PORTR|nr:hypothetical protein [Portunus trituberculatus]
MKGNMRVRVTGRAGCWDEEEALLVPFTTLSPLNTAGDYGRPPLCYLRRTKGMARPPPPPYADGNKPPVKPRRRWRLERLGLVVVVMVVKTERTSTCKQIPDCRDSAPSDHLLKASRRLKTSLSPYMT